MRSLLLFLPFLLASENAVIHMDGGVFSVTGYAAAKQPADGWQAIFTVYAGPAGGPPLLGQYSVQDGCLTFRPRFQLAPGMHVRAVFHPADAQTVEATFDLPAAAKPQASTRVSHIYPSTDVLPANALKMYIYFSAPMQKGDSWRHIHLLKEDGSPVEYPFLELDQELWDAENQRFTVLFDPGRIKRGLASLAEAGPILEAGHGYTLVVDRDWLDGRNAPLVEEFRKRFRVAAEERTPPNPSDWRVITPRANSKGPLALRFPKPLDYALLQHEITINSAQGAVAGVVTIDREETEWRFHPQEAWPAGDYQIIIRTTLEDLAGNHINRPFDIDVFDSISATKTRETVTLPLHIKP